MIPGRIPGRERWEVEDKLILSNATDKSGELKIYGGTAGEKALEIFCGPTSIFSILATSTVVQLLGGVTHPIQIGDAGTQSRGLISNDDLFVSGKLEVDGELYLDGGVRVTSFISLRDNVSLIFGVESDSRIEWSTNQAMEHTMVFGLGDTAKSIIFCDYADRAKNFDHAAQSNPRIFVQSSTDPDSENDEWISVSHEVTYGLIDCGSGVLYLGGTTVNLVNATLGSGTVTHDDYVILEVGGVEKKFMLGS